MSIANNSMPKMKPEFKHRLSVLGDDATPSLLADAIETMTHQSTNTLALVQQEFCIGGDDKMSDEVIYWTLDAVLNTIKDMSALVKAYRNAVGVAKDSGHSG